LPYTSRAGGSITSLAEDPISPPDKLSTFSQFKMGVEFFLNRCFLRRSILCFALLSFLSLFMMNLIKNKNIGKVSDDFGSDIAVTPQEQFVWDAYLAMDEASARGLERLRSEDGIIPSCKLGCSYCCRFHILVNIAEAHTLAQYVKRELSAEQINELRIRTQRWHAWDGSRPGRDPSVGINDQIDISNYEPCCPLLVNGACIAYPVRPVVCRTHFVCSHPLLCLAANNPKSNQDTPTVMTSIVTAASPFSMAIKNIIENEGMDSSRSIMLLPHWLAIQMNWDFAISP
jgi:hypothetical protein